MNTFFQAFQVKDERHLIKLNGGTNLFAFLRSEDDENEDPTSAAIVSFSSSSDSFSFSCCCVKIRLSSAFQNRASFLLFLMVSSTSYLLHIPHTVTFCSSKFTCIEYIPVIYN